MLTDRLISKIQYASFEPGEFTEERERNYYETILIIKSFPWEEQRNDLRVDITCPSVTIQTNDLQYLKLALYYNNKFVLYYYNGKNLFSKSLLRLTDAFEYIEKFYEQLTIDKASYKKEKIILKPLDIHFKSNDFIYFVNPRKPLIHTTWDIILSLVIILGSVIMMIVEQMSLYNVILASLFIIFIFSIIGGRSLYLVISYFKYSKGYKLQLSKGSPNFKYGTESAFIEYKKSEIDRIEIKEDETRGGPDFTVTTFYMKNGKRIIITNQLLHSTYIKYKMYDYNVVVRKVFIPLIKKDE